MYLRLIEPFQERGFFSGILQQQCIDLCNHEGVVLLEKGVQQRVVIAAIGDVCCGARRRRRSCTC